MGESNSKSSTGNPFVDMFVDTAKKGVNTATNVASDPFSALNPFSENNVVN